jgi:hypothetical protein
MSEHDDLKLFGVRRSEQKRNKLQDPLQGNGNDGQEHGFSPRKGRYFTQIELTHPTGNTVTYGHTSTHIDVAEIVESEVRWWDLVCVSTRERIQFPSVLLQR